MSDPVTSSSQTLSSVLILFEGGQLILPSNAVAEVLPYAPSLNMENAPPWIMGTILWQADPIPLVSLDNLFLNSDPEQVPRRIIILNMLTQHPRVRYFGLLSTDAPQRVLLQRNELQAAQEETEALPLGIASYGLLKERQIIIPDLDTIEAHIIKAVRRGR